MRMFAPLISMPQLTQIRLAVVGGTPDLLSKLESRGTVLITIPISERMIEAIVESRPTVVLLAKAIGVRTAVWLCRVIKERQELPQVPIIFYGHGDEPTTENAAFAAGADDYVARFGLTALLRARINAILRRNSANDPIDMAANKPAVHVGEIEVPFESYMANVSGKLIPLTVGEFRVLWKLATNVGRTLSASELSPTYMDLDGTSPDRSVRSHVWSLRRKLGRSAGAQIKTVRNAGYRITANRA